MKLYDFGATFFLGLIGFLIIHHFAHGPEQTQEPEPVIEYEQDCRYWSDIGGEKVWIGEDCGD